MLKKSFKTIGRHPFIFVIFGILAVVNLADQYLATMSIPNDNLNFIYTRWYIYGMLALRSVVLFAPFIYYIYLAATDNTAKGWYLKGIGRNWYKYMLVVVLMKLLGNQLWLWSHSIVPMADYGSVSRMEVAISVGRMGYALTALLTYLFAVPLIAEKRFSHGIKNIFTVGRKYFLRFLLAYVILYFLSWTPGINIYFGKVTIFGYYIMVYRSIITAAVQVFLYTYCMTMYVNYRETKKIENKEEEMIDA